MRTSGRVVGVILTLTLLATAVQAGVYSSAEPFTRELPSPKAPLEPLGDKILIKASPFRATMGDLTSLLVPPPKEDPESFRVQYLARMAELEKKHQNGTLTAEDRVDLSAAYIRLRRYEQAAEVLRPIAQDRANFRALANLATANHRAGRLDRAISYQEQAIQAWPEMVAGWTREKVVSHLRAEQYYLDLLKSRYREQLRGSKEEGLDPLFPKVPFTGREDYQAGSIPPALQAELPGDALSLVERLVLWMPDDNRLYWLFAEVLNAKGYVIEAATIFDELGEARAYNPREVRAHRRVLDEARSTELEILKKVSAADDEVFLGLLMPRAVGLGPGVAGLVAQSGWVAAAHLERQATSPGGFSPPTLANGPNDGAPLPEPPTNGIPDWKPISVSFVAGALVALLLSLQFRRR